MNFNIVRSTYHGHNNIMVLVNKLKIDVDVVASVQLFF
jgi:hypothetical protein